MGEFDSRVCTLGEGALWHPGRNELFWFDIVGKRLYSRHPVRGTTREIRLPEIFSVAGWVDEQRMVVGSETGIWLLHLETERLVKLIDLEADNPLTRSNDGRVDPWGGLWLGTMGKAEEPGEGALYRYYQGELRSLFANLTITNSICFAPDRSVAYFSDTACGQLYRVSLDKYGWPNASPEIFVDFKPLGLWPDGAVSLPDGTLRVALWGSGCVITVTAEGRLGLRFAVGAPHSTCPAYGGPDFSTLYCTSATQGMSQEALEHTPQAGMTFALEQAGRGQPEPAFDMSGIVIPGVQE